MFSRAAAGICFSIPPPPPPAAPQGALPRFNILGRSMTTKVVWRRGYLFEAMGGEEENEDDDEDGGHKL
ncbi:hypothetical protein V495_06607 [Pseudogymnoascus sp. VKM F-4514 (FW-929)]|nr:hypothetical protein V495_06607 [Pseudogymnoascus sp. VKM F-4514 (FW-929)]KFY52497.1 hypothetical protein V497_08515 [Pseudogymnoascus sp. VKM F-4516 (FW-969)]